MFPADGDTCRGAARLRRRRPLRRQARTAGGVVRTSGDGSALRLRTLDAHARRNLLSTVPLTANGQERHEVDGVRRDGSCVVAIASAGAAPAVASAGIASPRRSSRSATASSPARAGAGWATARNRSGPGPGPTGPPSTATAGSASTTRRGSTAPREENDCHRSDVAPILSAPVAVDEKVNLACSGARLANVWPAALGGQRALRRAAAGRPAGRAGAARRRADGRGHGRRQRRRLRRAGRRLRARLGAQLRGRPGALPRRRAGRGRGGAAGDGARVWRRRCAGSARRWRRRLPARATTGW